MDDNLERTNRELTSPNGEIAKIETVEEYNSGYNDNFATINKTNAAFSTTMRGQHDDIERNYELAKNAYSSGVDQTARNMAQSAYNQADNAYNYADSAYSLANNANNKANNNYNAIHGQGGILWNISWIQQNCCGYQSGGISTGPESGHMELLHGTEAIIPLEHGSVPVQLMGISGGSNGEDIQLLREQNTLLKQLVSQNGRPMNVEVEVGNEEFDAHILDLADNIRVKADRRKGMKGRRIR